MGAPVLEVSDQPQRKRLGIDAVLKLGAFKLPACHAIALVGIPAGRVVLIARLVDRRKDARPEWLDDGCDDGGRRHHPIPVTEVLKRVK